MICSALSSRARSKSAFSSKSSQDSGVSRPTNTLSHRHAEPVQEREEKIQNKKPTLASNSPSSASGTATSNSTSYHAAQPNPTQPNANPSHDARQATQYHRTTIYDLDETHARIHPANTETLACIASHRINSAASKTQPAPLHYYYWSTTKTRDDKVETENRDPTSPGRGGDLFSLIYSNDSPINPIDSF